MKNKIKCKQCRKVIEENDLRYTLPLGVVHSWCLDNYIKTIQEKQRAKKKKVRADMEMAKVENKRAKAKETLWVYVSEFIRMRDSDKDGYCHCISCGVRRHYKDFMDAGHFIPKSTGEYFYFNEDNIHAQCRDCNGFKGGKRVEYRKELIKKIGKDKVEELEKLEKERPYLKHTLEDYEKMKIKYRKKIKNEKLKLTNNISCGII